MAETKKKKQKDEDEITVAKSIFDEIVEETEKDASDKEKPQPKAPVPPKEVEKC